MGQGDHGVIGVIGQRSLGGTYGVTYGAVGGTYGVRGVTYGSKRGEKKWEWSLPGHFRVGLGLVQGLMVHFRVTCGAEL